ncbi:hypothetical protein QTP86_025045 [Hemibagrus guttatus]|nr:hypothetical protein QTP86_025045 [Hemibagrus guttatus]
MEDSSMIKILLFLTFSVHLSSAGTHTLQFFYTAVTAGTDLQEFSAVGLVDGEQCVSYNSSIGKMIPKTEWMQKIRDDDPDYWNRETQRLRDHQDSLAGVVKNLHQTEGNHTLQWMLGCALDNGTTRGYSQYRYDGEDLISLDLNWNLEHGQGTWTAANDKAKNFLKEWDPKGEEAEYWKNYLEYKCIDQLKKFVPYSKETLKRKDLPVNPVFQKHPACPEVLCQATGFFPEVVNITLRKDGEDVHEGVALRVKFPNQDGSFQKRSILKVPAEELQKHTYTCVIQHSSLKEELVLNVGEHRILSDVGSDGGSCVESDGGSDGGSDGWKIGVIVAVVAVLAVVAGVVFRIKKKGSENEAGDVFTLMTKTDDPRVTTSQAIKSAELYIFRNSARPQTPYVQHPDPCDVSSV